MSRTNVKQVNGADLTRFYTNLFEGTKTNYGFFGYPHTFSPITYKELLLPLPFLKIIDTYPMKKSNGKIQTSQCYKTYPRMDVTRFDHMVFAQSLGVDLLAILEENGYEIDNETKIAFLVFLLTHDIGHGPFSHPFEQMVDGYKGMHEDIGKRALSEIEEVRNALESIYPGLTDRLINFKKYDNLGLASLLEGIFDLDRAAFLIMDTYLMDGEEKSIAYDDVLESVYKIFKNIVLKDGKVYIKFEAFDAVDTFIRVRKENYADVYQSEERVLRDSILKRLGLNIQEYSKSLEYKERISKLPTMIGAEIEEFISFIAEMREKKAAIDLTKYYGFEDRDFNRIFYVLMLLDNPEISRDCFVLLANNEMTLRYYNVERNGERTGREDFYVNNKVNIYKSTPEENITFIKENGELVDYKDCEGRFTEELSCSEVLAYTRRDYVVLENEDKIREELLHELNKLLLEEKYHILMLVPREGYVADKVVIEQLQLYLASIEEGLSIEEYAEMNNMSVREVLCYLLMYSNHSRIKEICLLLLSDNMGVLLCDDDKKIVDSDKEKSAEMKLKKAERN